MRSKIRCDGYYANFFGLGSQLNRLFEREFVVAEAQDHDSSSWMPVLCNGRLSASAPAMQTVGVGNLSPSCATSCARSLSRGASRGDFVVDTACTQPVSQAQFAASEPAEPTAVGFSTPVGASPGGVDVGFSPPAGAHAAASTPVKQSARQAAVAGSSTVTSPSTTLVHGTDPPTPIATSPSVQPISVEDFIASLKLPLEKPLI
jgi:hypothetical protein